MPPLGASAPAEVTVVAGKVVPVAIASISPLRTDRSRARVTQALRSIVLDAIGASERRPNAVELFELQALVDETIEATVTDTLMALAGEVPAVLRSAPPSVATKLAATR